MSGAGGPPNGPVDRPTPQRPRDLPDPRGLPPVVVLLGGPSAEHDVSVVSGTAIATALAEAGATVRQVVIDLHGGWWWLPPDHRRGDRPASAYDDLTALEAEGPFTIGAAVDRLAADEPAPVVVIALHGPFGEDGTIQAVLDAADLAYTGSGVAASALGMDKALFKRLCRGLGLPVVDWREIRSDRWARDPDGVRAELDAFAAGGADTRIGEVGPHSPDAAGKADSAPAHDRRLMVKPARLGSSIGMTIVHEPAELAPALDHAFRFDDLALVERYLAGARDLEVSVIGNDPAAIETYGPGEIVSGHEFYDYAAKYTPGLSETSTQAEVTHGQRAQLHKLSRDVYRAIGAEGFARIDFLEAGGRVVVSEINTIPGFTPISLFPTMPAAGGYSFVDVCLRIIDLALQRHAARPRRHLETGDLPR
jgi:D-alanine-D-alanine ligase